MSQANMGSVGQVKEFRPALIRFGQDISRAIGDADAGILRAIQKLDSDIPSHWKRELARRNEKLSQAKDQLRAKTMYKDSSGKSPPCVDEQAAVRKWTLAVEEAQHKIMHAKRWHQALVQQYEQFRGRVRPARDLTPMMTEQAVHDFDRAIAAIEAYLALEGPDAPSPSL